MEVFVVRADFGRYTDIFKRDGYVGIGWFDKKYDSLATKEEIKTIYKAIYPNHVFMRMNQNSGQIFRFINDIKIGDIVITPYADNRLLIGKVTSDYYYEKDEACPFAYRKKVEWFQNTIDRQEFSIPLQNTLRSSLTCFSISQKNEILQIIGGSISGKIEHPPVFNNSDLYDQIRKKLLQLDSEEFEELVSYTLISLGFEAKQSIGKVGDGGIDYEGKLNVMGIAAINLQVQVKRYDKSSIGESDIRNFRGALKKDYQGCFITLSGFNKKAVDSANDQNKVQIYLIDGDKFIDIFIEQYEKIIDAMYEADNDELASKIKFKKALLPA